MKKINERYRHEFAIEQREGKSCWSFRVKYNGVQKTFKEDDYDNPREAWTEAVKFRNQLVEGRSFIVKDITIKEVLIESFDILLVRKKTRLNHLSIFNRYIKRDIQISQFNEEFAYRVLNDLVYNYSNDVITRTFSILKRIDQICLIKKYYDKSVMASIVCPKSHKIEHRKTKQPITKEELDLIKTTFSVAKNEFDRRQLPLLLDFFYYTGARPCEVWALTWEDVTDDYISINKEIGSDNTNERVVRQTKTPLSNRLLPITPKLKTTLYEARIVSNMIDNKNNLVFPNNKGDYHVTDIIGARLKKYAKKVNVRFSLYDIRHRFATDLTLNKVDDRTKQELMGHTSINMTLSYARSNDKAKKKALENR